MPGRLFEQVWRVWREQISVSHILSPRFAPLPCLDQCAKEAEFLRLCHSLPSWYLTDTNISYFACFPCIYRFFVYIYWSLSWYLAAQCDEENIKLKWSIGEIITRVETTKTWMSKEGATSWTTWLPEPPKCTRPLLSTCTPHFYFYFNFCFTFYILLFTSVFFQSLVRQSH